MKIALIGYGKMGKLIEQAALAKGHAVIAKIGSNQPLHSMPPDLLSHADVCIDFTHPSCVLENTKVLASLGKNIVMGTTGWYEHLDEVKSIVESKGIGFLYSPNFSLGISLFLQMITQAAALISPYDIYDVAGYEMHHNQKADAPSGTAQAIVKQLLSNIARKQGVCYEHTPGSQDPAQNQLHFSSLRVGSVPGEHAVIFDSPFDTITLTHTARSREGFAQGAVYAAQWLQGKAGFFQDFSSEAYS